MSYQGKLKKDFNFKEAQFMLDVKVIYSNFPYSLQISCLCKCTCVNSTLLGCETIDNTHLKGIGNVHNKTYLRHEQSSLWSA